MTVFIGLIFYIICALNIISGIRKRKDSVLFAAALLLVFILMTFNYKGPDIGVYMAAYDKVRSSAKPFQAAYMEWGYTLLSVMCGKMGLDFFAFRAVLSIIILSLFANTIKYYKAQGNLIIGVYMLYLFIFDTIQIRNCIVQFIVLFATRYLFRKSRWSTLKFLICIAIAGSFHTIAYAYLSLILIKIFKKTSFYQWLFMFVIALFGVFIVLQPLLPQIEAIISKFLSRGIGYLSGTITIGWLIVFLLYIIGLIALYSYKSKVRDRRAKSIIEMIIKVNIILGLFLPLTFFNNNFNRIFRNNIILTLIGLTLIYKNSVSANDRRLSLCAFIAINGGWIYSDIFARYDINVILNPIFESNLVVNGLAASNLLLYTSVIVLSLAVIWILKIIVYPKRSMNRRVVSDMSKRIRVAYD